MARAKHSSSTSTPQRRRSGGNTSGKTGGNPGDKPTSGKPTRSKPNKAQARPDLYQEVTDRVIAKLEAGTAPWRCPWNRYGLARNYVSGKAYQGINSFLLNFLPVHPIPYYLSFKQAGELGGRVRKGARAERVYFFKALYQDAAGKTISPERAEQLATSGQPVRRIPFLRSFAVFNVADVEGITLEPAGGEGQLPRAHSPLAACEDLLCHTERLPSIVHEVAGEAFYHPASDVINLPAPEVFHGTEQYYSTLFHELTHSTGHAGRLNRPGITGPIAPGSAEYAREELIAEMGASFLCAHTGIDVLPVTENSAAYLSGWLQHLRSDKQLIFRAAAAAQRSTNFLLYGPGQGEE